MNTIGEIIPHGITEEQLDENERNPDNGNQEDNSTFSINDEKPTEFEKAMWGSLK